MAIPAQPHDVVHKRFDKKKTTLSKEISGPHEFPRNFLVPRNSQEVLGLQKFSGVSWFQEKMWCTK
ncbi:hypothetical protein MAR_013879, partial [Mya arenaria]